jgi:secreted repeat protein with Y-X4-D motif
MTFLAGATALVVAALAFAGCGGSGGSNANSPAPPKNANGQSATVGVATSDRSDGKPQVTYNGHPLYLFSADQKAGDTNGQGVNAFGGLWYVLSSSGDEITTPTGSGGFGY